MKLHPVAVIAALFLASPAAHAAPSDDLVAALGRCAALTDDSARLACYDKVAGEAKSTSVATAPAVTAQPSAPAAAAQPSAPQAKEDESWFGLGDLFGTGRSPEEQTKPEQFGSENLPPPPPKPGEASPPAPLDSITATVADFAYNPFGRFTVFLDNGQIWQQLQGDTDRARFSKNKKDQVTISRGLLGSYNLMIGDSMKIYKVKRLK